MSNRELLAALRRLKVQTGSLACLGCGYEHDCGVHGCMILRKTIAWMDTPDDLPAADVAPVVYGRWEFLGPNRLIKECMCGTCSVCKIRSKYIVNTALCPNCGAKMTEE